MKKITDIGLPLTREQQKEMVDQEDGFCSFRYCGNGGGYCVPLIGSCICTVSDPLNSCGSD
ncbi:hypothetical protein [Puia sp.]|jgi:hypothetical protein|uniref:hypothetical protein n=1 Tax=Puia sp. TaxID=2045100 RepID=UPI002F42735F